MRQLIASWWHGDGPSQDTDPSLEALGTVSPRWLLQYQQQDRVLFDGVTWTWPVTTKPRMGEAPGCGDRASSAAACLYTGAARGLRGTCRDSGV